MEKFLIIDGNSIANRAFYALPLLSNSRGEYSNAVYGFVNSLTKAIVDLKPKYIAVAFDIGKKTFRNALYADYKAKRKPMPSELASQMPILKTLLDTMKIKYFEKKDIEADDIIGTLSKTEGVEKVLLSGDRDLFQLLDDQTIIWFPKRGVSEIDVVTSQNLKEKMGLLPNQIVDYKALRGDSSDNIPGVVGIGEKGATELLLKFGNLDNIYQNLDKINEKLRTKLLNGRDLAYLSRQLASINRDVPLSFKLEDLTYQFPYSKETYEFFKNYEFKSLIRRTDIFDENASSLAKEESLPFETIKVSSKEMLDKIVGYIKAEGKFAFDFSDKLKIACTPNILYTFESEISMFESGLSIEAAFGGLKEVFENSSIKKICFGLKEKKHILDKFNVQIFGEVFDIVIARYLLGQSTKDAADEPTYYFFMEKSLRQKMEELGLDLLYQKIELPLVDVLFSMENDGLLIDQEELLRLKSSLEVELDEIVKKVIELAGENFNINSPKQLSAILFGKLGLKARRNTKLSTNVEVLQQIEDQHEIVPQILRYRKIQKLLSTYVEAFCQFSKQNDGYIKTIFNQTLTSTGRLSSSEPNLQNLPIRDEEGRKLRKLFISRFPGGQMVSADYNQIELRLMAHYSQDSTMIESYRRNEDIHARTASEIFGVPLSEVTPNERRLAKTVNFGIIYGISEYGLSVNLGTSVIRATEYMNKYFSRFPRVKEYMNESIAIARQNGYAKTLFGRIRYIPELSSSNGGIRKFGERVAINMPLQGTASDIIKLAMINVYKEIKNKNLKAKLVLQIHDELVVDCPKDEVSEVLKILSKEMEGVVSLSVPLPVEVSSGSSLYEC